MRVALVNNNDGQTRDQRDIGLLKAVRHAIDCHGWTLSWDTRGVRLTHAKHSLTLGVPATFTEYLSGTSFGASA